MASNPLPPKPRKTRFGRAARRPRDRHPRRAGALQPQGAQGEVAIRGDNVTTGYETNPEANAGAFTDGWFRTGDLGFFDEDGYLTITGRLKEIINRGGEKISPREVDEVLTGHDAVAQAVTFAVPHGKLGEDVAAAVVLREGRSLTEKELARFCRGAACRLQGSPHRRVPRRDTQGRDRQAAAHRPRRAARANQNHRGRPMKICIFGAGAIGGHVGALLSRAGLDVTLIARGPHLAAMKQHGLTLVTGDGDEFIARPRCTDDPVEAGIQDYVLIALKAHSVPLVADRMAPLLGPDTVVVPVVNGIPWWYFHKLEGPYEDHRIACVDPDDRQWTHIGPERVVGCVVWTSAEIQQPGVIKHSYGNRMPLGEPDGSRSERALQLSKAMIAAGLKSPIRPKIRNEIWMKLWGNLSFNPVSALTDATLENLATDRGCRDLLRAMMEEGRAVGEALGAEFPMDVDTRIKGRRRGRCPPHVHAPGPRPGRPMEIDALVSSVVELGRLVGVPTPTIALVHALVVRRAREAGCYPG